MNKIQRVIIIGPNKEQLKEIAQTIGIAFNLPVRDMQEFRSNHLKEKPNGIYLSTTLLYQQAKKMKPDMLISTFDEYGLSKPGNRARRYKLVDENGEVFITENGVICDNLPYAAAQIQIFRNRNRNPNLKLELDDKYEKYK